MTTWTRIYACPVCRYRHELELAKEQVAVMVASLGGDAWLGEIGCPDCFADGDGQWVPLVETSDPRTEDVLLPVAGGAQTDNDDAGDAPAGGGQQ